MVQLHIEFISIGSLKEEIGIAYCTFIVPFRTFTEK